MQRSHPGRPRLVWGSRGSWLSGAQCSHPGLRLTEMTVPAFGPTSRQFPTCLLLGHTGWGGEAQVTELGHLTPANCLAAPSVVPRLTVGDSMPVTQGGGRRGRERRCGNHRLWVRGHRAPEALTSPRAGGHNAQFLFLISLNPSVLDTPRPRFVLRAACGCDDSGPLGSRSPEAHAGHERAARRPDAGCGRGRQP